MPKIEQSAQTENLSLSAKNPTKIQGGFLKSLLGNLETTTLQPDATLIAQENDKLR
jgi:hypothetical protein